VEGREGREGHGPRRKPYPQEEWWEVIRQRGEGRKAEGGRRKEEGGRQKA